MKRTVVLAVPEDSPPDRLDHYLSVCAPGLSRTRAKEIIVGGLVTVNGRIARPSHEVRPGDTIEAEVPEPPPLRAAPEAIPLDICHEDEHILVVNKSAGMVVHPAPGSPSGTLVNALLAHCGDLSGTGGPLRPGVVHRLDRDTSGVIIVAKNDSAHRALASMLERREIKKTYLALVWGQLAEPRGRIEAAIGRSPSDRKKMAVVESGRLAATQWKVREEFPFATFVELRPETGRTHQIRVHMAHLHHPVIGDSQYGGVKRSFGDVAPHWRRHAKRVNSLAARQALHARALGFRHPVAGRPMRVAAPLPDDFAELLSCLRFPDGERGRVVGVDPGETRVGLALSDEGRIVAQFLETLEGLDDGGVAGVVARICREKGADRVVVGYPIRMDGTVGARARRARELAMTIEDAARARVVLWDERLSSAEARRVMRETGKRARGRKGKVDQIAASLILQGYLDSVRST